MFSKLNDLTLTTMVYELFESRTFKKGEVIMEQSKSAPTNEDYKPFYQIQLSKMAMQIKKRKQGLGDNTNNTSVMQAESVVTPAVADVSLYPLILLCRTRTNPLSTRDRAC